MAEWYRTELEWNSDLVCKRVVQNPRLFGQSVANARTHLEAVQALGLSRTQVLEMVTKTPGVLEFDSSTIQRKVKFMVEEMGLPLTALLKDPTFLARSLTNTIGPRWAFSLLYCSNQPRPSTSRPSLTEQKYTNGLKSPSLDAVCARRDMTRLQLFMEFKIQWQQREGRVWGK